MTAKKRFELLLKYIREDDVNVEIDTSYYELAKTKKEDRIINGSAGTDGYIILYKDSKDSNYDMLSSLLIHEYGHIVLWRDYKRESHTEKQAWLCGIKTVPPKYWPPTLKEDCRICLTSYNYKDFRWLEGLVPEFRKNINK